MASVAVISAACAPTTPRAASPTSVGTARAAGTADVAYAGSLQLLDEKIVGPAFTRATGYAYQGRGGGSFGLSQEILAHEISPNVFESIGAAPIEPLEPGLTNWYVRFASSPLVVAYNPSSRFAPELAAIASGRRPLTDLFTVMAEPGFLLGRTNPSTDPQGQAFYEMVELAQARLGLPAGTVARVLGQPDNPAQIFSETSLEARLQAGQLDASSAFLSQAVQLRIPYIALPADIDFGNPAMASIYATATVSVGNNTVVHGVPLVVDITTLGEHDAQAADAFVAYLLSAVGRQEMSSAGYELLPPTAFGQLSAIPAAVRHELAGA